MHFSWVLTSMVARRFLTRTAEITGLLLWRKITVIFTPTVTFVTHETIRRKTAVFKNWKGPGLIIVDVSR
jgi:hypothetical protein